MALNSALISALLLLSTFDSVVVPHLRLSIGDISIILGLLILGLSKDGIKSSAKLLFVIFPLLVVGNAIIYINFTLNHLTNFEPTILLRGFFRPFLFAVLAINLYYAIKKINLSQSQLLCSISIASVSLSAIVLLQYFAVWPIHYHNNPAFGEVGRITYFAEGWRPTGLTNEASFVGIFLVLMLSLQLALIKIINNSSEPIKSIFIKCSPYITLIGCFLTTSRIALVVGIVVLALNMKIRNVFVIALLMITAFFVVGTNLVPDRLLNLVSPGGDYSIIERYGSKIAYFNAIVSLNYPFGVGFLNGSNIAINYASLDVIKVLDGRKMPSFSIPLQAALEFGLAFIVSAAFFLIYFRKHILFLPFVAVVLCSLVTGLHNFLFIYIFIAISVYAKITYRQ